MNKGKSEKAYCKEMEGTHIRKIGQLILAAVLLSGCSENGFRIDNGSDADAAKAEEVLNSDDRLTSAVTVFHENDVIAGVTLKTFSRFKKEKIEKELKGKLEKLYPDLDVTVSADSKIWMETKKLMDFESEEKKGKKIKELKSLIKEET